MQRRRLKSMLVAAVLISVIWVVAAAGFYASKSEKMTGEKIRQYVRSINFKKLSSVERSQVLLELASKLNALPREERHQASWEEDWRPWFSDMTEREKEQFINATLPADVSQMIESFERMPADQRKKTIQEAMKNLKKTRDLASGISLGDDSANAATNAPVLLSPELAQKAQTLGLKTYFSESSAETKAELAPLLEEIQHQMESGRTFH